MNQSLETLRDNLPILIDIISRDHLIQIELVLPLSPFLPVILIILRGPLRQLLEGLLEILLPLFSKIHPDDIRPHHIIMLFCHLLGLTQYQLIQPIILLILFLILILILTLHEYDQI